MCTHNIGSSLEFFQLLNTEEERGMQLGDKTVPSNWAYSFLKKNLKFIDFYLHFRQHPNMYDKHDCAHNVCAFVKPETRLFSVHFLQVKAFDS